MKSKFLICGMLIGLAAPLNAAPLTESTFTEVINDVKVVATATRNGAPAKLNDPFKAPDLVRTGTGSRAELTAPDQTITRVGANTVFSFEPAGRNLRLEQGSVLFHSPAGKGGGTIKTGGATAAVLGTTIIVVATLDGGFKLIVLEGEARATLPNGKSVKLKAGQLVFVLAGGKEFSKVLDINLGRLVGGSLLITGFAQELPSFGLIQAAVNKQNESLAKGRAEDTGIPADKFARSHSFGNGMLALDNNTYITSTLPFVTQGPLGQSQDPDAQALAALQGRLINHFPLAGQPVP